MRGRPNPLRNAMWHIAIFGDCSKPFKSFTFLWIMVLEELSQYQGRNISHNFTLFLGYFASSFPNLRVELSVFLCLCNGWISLLIIIYESIRFWEIKIPYVIYGNGRFVRSYWLSCPTVYFYQHTTSNWQKTLKCLRIRLHGK